MQITDIAILIFFVPFVVVAVLLFRHGKKQERRDRNIQESRASQVGGAGFSLGILGSLLSVPATDSRKCSKLCSNLCSDRSFDPQSIRSIQNCGCEQGCGQGCANFVPLQCSRCCNFKPK